VVANANTDLTISELGIVAQAKHNQIVMLCPKFQQDIVGILITYPLLTMARRGSPSTRHGKFSRLH